MLKKVSLITVTLAILLAFSLQMTACSKKTALTDTQFTDLTQQAGYAVTAISADTKRFDTTDVTASMQATGPDGKITIEFYVFSSADTALTASKIVDKNLNALGGVWTLTVHSTNSYWRGTNNGTFYFYSLVGDTIVYVQTDNTNKDAVSKMLKTLGYW